ncbi:MAG: modulator of FtsH protease [Francisellaceae bacterium]|jgi:modulator of FtsH protease
MGLNNWGPNNFNKNKSQARTVEHRAVHSASESIGVLKSNTVLRNTYLLLSLTLIFSAITAGLSMVYSVGQLNPILFLVVYFGLFFAIAKTKNSPMGLVFTFALTGFLGWTIGPILNMYIATFQNGSQLIMMALGGTGSIFLILSALALNPKRNLANWGSFLMVGVVIAIIAVVLNLFLQLTALQLAISVVFFFLSAGIIMWQTNMIVHGGETNYIMATVTLYVSIFNIFLILLQFLGMSSGNRN